MKGNSINEFIDDILTMGGPEKEFIFKEKYYFLETLLDKTTNLDCLHVYEYDNSDPKNKRYICTYNFTGHSFSECFYKFEKAKIFEGLTIYQAEKDIEVLFG